MAANDSYRLGLVLVTASAIAWSTTGFFTRLIHLDAATMLVWRGLFGAAAMLAFIASRRHEGGIAAFAGLGAAGWLLALVSGAGMVCFISALSLTTVAHVAIIYATAPFVAAAMGWLALRETPSGSAIIASLTALAGVAIMVGGGGHGASVAGDLLAFGMTAAMAAMMVIGRARPGIPTLPAACLSALLSALAAAPLAQSAAASPLQWIELALFGITNSALGIMLFMLGSRYLPPVETALIGALEAPLAPAWVWFAFSETPPLRTLAGGTVVLAAVFAHVLLSQTVSRRWIAAQE
jgi:drug/metabolite transporter (DMT)-like permease